MIEPEVYKVAGESPPFLTGSKACLERLGRVIIRHGLNVTSSHYFSSGCGELSTYDSFTVSLTIPASLLEQVEKELRCTLTDHLDVQVGHDCYRSVKWRDKDGTRYTSPYPSKEERWEGHK